jgi:hypothetical protein
MPYFETYTAQFQSNQSTVQYYTLRIYSTTSPASVGTLLLGGQPVVQEWQEDDPLAPIRGCTLKINIIANHGNPNYTEVKLTDFYSENDNEFYVTLEDDLTDELLFSGYVLQDDCSEIQVDFAHEIQLTATDNLATLKEIRFDQAVINEAIPITLTGQFDSFITSGVNYITFDNATEVEVVAGQTITISGTATALDGVWTIISNVFSPSPINLNTFVIVETVPVITNANGTLDYGKRTPLRGYVTLREIVRNCLLSTNLDLVHLNVLANIYPTNGTNGIWMDDTYVNILSFKNESTWDTCYDILDKIMRRFRSTLFQAHGQWWVVRWAELWRWADSNGMSFSGWQYSSAIDTIASPITFSTYNSTFNAGDIQTGWMQSIVRPLKYTQETMQYNQVANIITNGDLSILGPLIRTYTATIDGVLCDVNEYQAPFWYGYPTAYPTLTEFYIRVATAQTTNQEVQRMFVIDATDAVTPAVYSNDIDVEIGDVIEFSFDVRTSISQTGNNSFVYYLYISDTAPSVYTGLQPNTSGYWVSVPGINMQYSGVNTNDWANFSIKTLPSPRRGRMIIAIPGICFGGGETYYKNFSINISNNINNLQRIIGHRHQDTLPLSTKNVDEVEIMVDDTRSNLISGTMFLQTYTDLIRDRVQTWNFDTGTQILETRLGQITTMEMEFWRRKPRAKYNGTLIKAYDFNSGKAITPLTCVKLMYDSSNMENLRFVFGALMVDYKAHTSDCTLYEICQLDESIDDFNDDTYTFIYLYENN